MYICCGDADSFRTSGQGHVRHALSVCDWLITVRILDVPFGSLNVLGAVVYDSCAFLVLL